MQTLRQLYIHIVFSTKHRKNVLLKNNREKLFNYIWGILKNLNIRLLRVNGVDDHIHIFIDMPTNIVISELVKTIKKSTNKFIKSNNLFLDFNGWQNGYGAFSCSLQDKKRIINYIKNQEEHHRKTNLRDELKSFFISDGVDYSPEFFDNFFK